MSLLPYTTILLYPLRTASTVYCVHCVLWFDLFAPKTMSPPLYTTILLHPLCTASTASTASSGFTFLYQRQCPHYHKPLLHCTLHTAYCIHWFDIFAPKTMSPPPYITIPLCPLHSVPTGLTFLHQRTMFSPPYITIPLCPLHTGSTGLTFLQERQCPYHHIPLFYCVLHPLRPLV